MIIPEAERIFYHLYPLGFCGAARRNDFASPAGTGLRAIAGHIPRLRDLGVNALYLGPLFESTAHGYDTLDYYWVDRRLGTNGDLKALVQAFHEAGIMVILDGVFNHTGRRFFAFRDLQEKREASAYRDWFSQVDFSRPGPAGDPFCYEGWNGCYDLIKLNGHNRNVREYLLGAVRFWIDEFDIDGLRLDAADLLLPDFMEELNRVCTSSKPGFYLLGEVIHGDYRHWAAPGRLDSVTNYELYKGLWSSLKDHNFFELAWTLNRQFGTEGLYRDLLLYNFVDNHDVNRVASILNNEAQLFPLYGLLFTVPGIPSIYYGSEYGVRGEKQGHSDAALRPAWESLQADSADGTGTPAALFATIRRLAALRRGSRVLREGSYRELYKSPEQFAFMREVPGERVLAAVNISEGPAVLRIPGNILGIGPGRWRDLLDGASFTADSGGLTIPLDPSWLRVLVLAEREYPC